MPDSRSATRKPEGAVPERPPVPKESSMTAIRERLVDEFVSMLSEAEDLLKRAGTETGERARDLRAQVEGKLLAAKLRLQELEGEAVDRARDAARYIDDDVHENPWRAIGIAAAIGFVAGLLVSRR
jgi:ElaB/YqjD/DUF883 family membrane-anchored ribosome-binding protein